ncbi:kinesin-like protein KIF13B, partial [Clonorchis sinensis]
ALADHLQRHSRPEVKTEQEISILEIYNEKIHDLLAERNNKGQLQNLRIREHPNMGPYVEGLSKVQINEMTRLDAIIAQGIANRKTAENEVHLRSSRSHVICTIYYHETTSESNYYKDFTSKLSLIDLAGSEKAHRTANFQRFDEGRKINLSLSSLSTVISRLADKSQKDNPDADVITNSSHSTVNSTRSSRQSGIHSSSSIHIPYRNSKLTWLLSDSLGGNARTTMIATLSPSYLQYQETLNTLRYAQQAKLIVNQPKLNMDSSAIYIRQLLDEITILKKQLHERNQCLRLPNINWKTSGKLQFYQPGLRRSSEACRCMPHHPQQCESVTAYHEHSPSVGGTFRNSDIQVSDSDYLPLNGALHQTRGHQGERTKVKPIIHCLVDTSASCLESTTSSVVPPHHSVSSQRESEGVFADRMKSGAVRQRDNSKGLKAAPYPGVLRKMSQKFKRSKRHYYTVANKSHKLVKRLCLSSPLRDRMQGVKQCRIKSTTKPNIQVRKRSARILLSDRINENGLDECSNLFMTTGFPVSDTFGVSVQRVFLLPPRKTYKEIARHSITHMCLLENVVENKYPCDRSINTITTAHTSPTDDVSSPSTMNSHDRGIIQSEDADATVSFGNGELDITTCSTHFNDSLDGSDNSSDSSLWRNLDDSSLPTSVDQRGSEIKSLHTDMVNAVLLKRRYSIWMVIFFSRDKCVSQVPIQTASVTRHFKFIRDSIRDWMGFMIAARKSRYCVFVPECGKIRGATAIPQTMDLKDPKRRADGCWSDRCCDVLNSKGCSSQIQQSCGNSTRQSNAAGHSNCNFIKFRLIALRVLFLVQAEIDGGSDNKAVERAQWYIKSPSSTRQLYYPGDKEKGVGRGKKICLPPYQVKAKLRSSYTRVSFEQAQVLPSQTVILCFDAFLAQVQCVPPNTCSVMDAFEIQFVDQEGSPSKNESRNRPVVARFLSTYVNRMFLVQTTERLCERQLGINVRCLSGLAVQYYFKTDRHIISPKVGTPEEYSRCLHICHWELKAIITLVQLATAKSPELRSRERPYGKKTQLLDLVLEVQKYGKCLSIKSPKSFKRSVLACLPNI